MKTNCSLLVAICVIGCAARNSYPGADPAHIIACRNYSAGFGAARVNGEFNACMEEAGYKPAPRKQEDRPKSRPPCIGRDCNTGN